MVMGLSSSAKIEFIGTAQPDLLRGLGTNPVRARVGVTPVGQVFVFPEKHPVATLGQNE
jgi:hypothetical protein